MRVDFESKPLAIHEPFHRSTSYERMLFGAFGSGKTYAIIDEAIAWCLEQPGVRGLIARKTVPELRDTTEPIFRERLPAALWGAGEVRRSGGHMESFTFPNGSVVLFRSLDDWNKHRSLNLGFIAYDECNEIDQETYQGMESRVRQVDLTAEARAHGYDGKITRRGIWGATNPNGKDWLYRRFHPDSPDRVAGTEAFMSTSLDNPYLPAEFLERLLLYPKPWVKRYVLCQFDDFAGRIYDEWSYERHVLPRPDFRTMDVRPLVWMGMDPGTQSPTAGLWVWLDTDNRRLVGIAEYERAGVAVDVHVAEWRRIEAEARMTVRWRVADPNSITQRDRGSALSLQTQYSKQGYHFNLGASSNESRIPALGHLIHTGRFVVAENCMRTFEAIRDYQWKDLTPAAKAAGEDPKEVPLKKNDHLVNCAQYLAGREAPMPKLRPQHPDSFQDDIHRTIRKQLARKRRQRMGRSHDYGSMAV